MRSFIFNIIFYPLTLFTAAAFLVIAPFSGRKTARWCLRRHCLNVMWLTKTVMGAKIEIRGLEQFQNGRKPALIVSKHQSELDVFPPLALFPELAAIAMSELNKYPLIGPALRKFDYIMVSVEGARTDQLKDVVRGSKRVHAEGRPILIYPEGELMRLGARERYRTGVFHIYRELGCEATPVAVSCGLVWPQREWTKRANQTCVLEFMEPIAPGLEKEAFMEELERRIEGRSMELIREHGPAHLVAEAERRHREGVTNDDDAPRRPPIPGLTDQSPDPGSEARQGV